MPKAVKSKLSVAKKSVSKSFSTKKKKSIAGNELNGKLFVFTGTSGAGKTTIGKAILNEFDFFKRIVTCTTRPMRDGERDGVDYHFFSKDRFLDLLGQNAFLEHAVVYDNYYGSLRSEVAGVLGSGKSVLLIVDVQGAITIKKSFPSAIVFFIKAPSLSILKKRLILRGVDSMSVIEQRVSVAKQELKLEHNFDKVLVNDDLQSAILEVKKLILNELGV